MKSYSPQLNILSWGLDNIIQKCITDHENDALCGISSYEEVKWVVWSINLWDSSTGLDGMLGLFYQHFWEIVGDQLVDAVQSFFRIDWLSQELNRSFIILIPKSPNSHSFSEFRPISLSNLSFNVYKKFPVRFKPLPS